MSTKNLVVAGPGNGYNNIKQVTWPTLINGDAGDSLGPDMALWSDRSVQVTGTFGSGGTVLVEGSNDGTTWFTLNSPQGTALSFTAAGLKQILEGVLFIRPRVSAGDGTTAIAVAMMLRLPTLRGN